MSLYIIGIDNLYEVGGGGQPPKRVCSLAVVELPRVTCLVLCVRSGHH